MSVLQKYGCIEYLKRAFAVSAYCYTLFSGEQQFGKDYVYLFIGVKTKYQTSTELCFPVNSCYFLF